jgi:hypothetical protein
LLIVDTNLLLLLLLVTSENIAIDFFNLFKESSILASTRLWMERRGDTSCQ